MHHALSQLESSSISGIQIIAYDYTKAFDVLPHNLIISRLLQADLPVGFVQWIGSYLSGRKQAVRVGATISSPRKVTSGVPQGSVLGPLLFCVATADLRALHDSTMLVKYVDDTTICVPLFRHQNNAHVSDEHQHILDWSSANGFKINFSKCKSIFYSKSKSHGAAAIDLQGVRMVNTIRLLGVTLSGSLSWNLHVRNVCAVASKRMYCLRILKPLLPTKKLILVYNSLVRSVLEYASPALGMPHLWSRIFLKLRLRSFC